MKSPEQSIDANRGKFESLPLGVKRAHEHLEANKAKYEGPGYKIQLPDFVSHYGPQQVIEDQQKVVALDKKFKERDEQWQVEAKKMADVLEAIIIDESEMSNWLGDSVTTRRTTTFDDYINGVDMVAEYRRENDEGFDTLALGVDVTFGKKTVQSKLDRIRANIDARTMGTVKYYEDSNGDFTGQLNNVPQFVVGVDRDTINNLSALWVDGEKDKLAQHPVQIVLLKEILTQAIQFGEYAERSKHPKAAKAYKRVARIISEVLESKKDINTSGYEYDRIAQEIAHHTKKACA